MPNPKSALGRVLLKRGLKKELKRFQDSSSDPMQVARAVRGFRESDPNTTLISGRIDETLRLCDEQMRIELNKGGGTMDAGRAVEMLTLIDKSRLSPAELDQLADNSLGRSRRMKFISREASEMEEELAAHKENWGKGKADSLYRSTAKKPADAGGFLNQRATAPPTAQYRKVAEPLGLTEAEYLAIYTYTSSDYLYINPVMANHQDKGKGEAWMRAALFPVPTRPDEPVMPNLPEGHPDYAQANGKYKLDKQFYAGRLQAYETLMVNYRATVKNFEEGGVNDKGSRSSLREEGSLHAGMLDKALRKLPMQEKNLFRGMRLSDKQFDAMAVGDVFPFENFTSMSTEESVARLFAEGTKCQFESDRTVSVIVMTRLGGWDVKALSAEATENELMVPPGDCTITAIEDDSRKVPGLPEAKRWKVVRLERRA